MAKILLVEDDDSLAFLLKMQLEQLRHLVDVARKGLDAISQLRCNNSYELIILDWMLPDIAGVEVCKQYRSSGGRVPVLMLTAKGTVEDKATGLNAGADDYLVKPFHPTELDARVNALLRRPTTYAGKKLLIRDIELDTASGTVSRAGHEIELTAKEFSLLELLMRYPNQSFSLEAILDRVWDSDSAASIDTVRTHMKTLRKKIGDNNEEDGVIRTKRGQGYRIVDHQ
ncbi:MAG: response regulator transcription factor [Candidatus Melainabacteria bacterium]|nr:response regulator transcription factor [Candidatus Melainabacteria bacterium]